MVIQSLQNTKAPMGLFLFLLSFDPVGVEASGFMASFGLNAVAPDQAETPLVRDQFNNPACVNTRLISVY
jgi:hypothetical protein